MPQQHDHDSIRAPLDRSWHSLGIDQTLSLLRSHRVGLTSAGVAARRAAYGANELPRARRSRAVEVYLRQFKSPLIYLLLAASAISLALGDLLDAGFIFAVLQLNALIGTVQEWKAETSAESLRQMVRFRVVVRRDGRRMQVESAALVPGDIVLLESGSRVPADIRLLSARELRIDEALLTGESMPVDKDADALHPAATVVGDRSNMLHAGTVVIGGRAEGVVVLTGLESQIGHITEALVATEAAPAPLVLRLEAFSRRLGVLVLLAVAALLIAEMARGMALGEVFFVAVALAVSAIPEGLPVAITVALSIGAARMAKRNVIVRSLPAVEGLGACTLIASDKTGTLTVNQLAIRRVFLPTLGEFEIGSEGQAGTSTVVRTGGPLDEADQALRWLATVGALCNEAALHHTEDGAAAHLGDTVDIAFLLLARDLGIDHPALLDAYPEIDAVPYEPRRRFAASIRLADGRCLTLVKGAPETVLPMCAAEDAEALLAEAERLASDGYRVLAVASSESASAPAMSDAFEALHDLDFLGYVGLIDPLRAEVPDAVAQARAAGIEVRLITGDHPATAAAVGRELGLLERPDEIVTGAGLAALESEPAAFDLLVRGARAFARVQPVQKLLIVQSLRRLGHFVAVTGDGANDAPALRAANIGIAMGEGGTDIARHAADLILADDNFSSIVAGIEEGRIAYANVRKIVYLLVSTGAAEIVVFFLSLFAGLPLPLYAAQLLWLNLVTNGVQDVALAFERGEPHLLRQRPRPPEQPIFDPAMIRQTVLSGLVIGVVGFGFFWGALARGWSEAEARNALLLLMVLFENVHVFNCRSETRSALRVPFAANPLLVGAVLAAQSVHIGAMFVPGLNAALAIAPVSLATWALVAGLSLTVLAAMEIYKAWRARWRAPGPPNDGPPGR